MAAFTIERKQKWGDVVAVEMSCGAGSAGPGGDTFDLLIPGGYWKVVAVSGAKGAGTSGAGDSVSLQIVHSGSATNCALILGAAGVAPGDSLRDEALDTAANLVEPGDSLRLVAVNDGVGTGVASTIWVHMVQANPE